jgi:hypothetical protein
MTLYQHLSLAHKNDDLLYHYTTSKTALEYILKNKSLKLNPLSETNDPLEYNDKIHVREESGDLTFNQSFEKPYRSIKWKKGNG